MTKKRSLRSELLASARPAPRRDLRQKLSNLLDRYEAARTELSDETEAQLDVIETELTAQATPDQRYEYILHFMARFKGGTIEDHDRTFAEAAGSDALAAKMALIEKLQTDAYDEELRRDMIDDHARQAAAATNDLDEDSLHILAAREHDLFLTMTDDEEYRYFLTALHEKYGFPKKDIDRQIEALCGAGDLKTKIASIGILSFFHAANPDENLFARRDAIVELVVRNLGYKVRHLTQGLGFTANTAPQGCA